MAVQSIVIYRKQLGDLLLLQPALALLAGQQAGSVGVLTRPGMADLLSLMPGAIAPITPWQAMAGAATVYAMQSGDTWRAAVIPARKKILCLTRSTAGFWQPRVFSEIRVESAATRYRALVNFCLLGGRVEDFLPPSLRLPPADWLPTGLPESYLLLHPTSAWREKSWAAHHWVQVVRQFRKTTSLPVLVTGGSTDWEQAMCREIASGAEGEVSNLAGRTSLREYMALISRAQAVLCVDGSASHLAAAFGRPALTLFGPTNPVHWHLPSPASRMLLAENFVSGVRKPAVDYIPVQAVLDEISQLPLS